MKKIFQLGFSLAFFAFGFSQELKPIAEKVKNAQLKNKGYLTIPGKIPTEYFREKWYGAERKEAVSV